MRLAALLLLVAGLGLPINDLLRYGLLVVAAVLVLRGTVAARLMPWVLAGVAVVICMLGRSWLAPPSIEEGHNVFIVDRVGGALETGLPREAFRLMAEDFDARYPPEHRCDRSRFGCWRAHGFPDAAFAFSADGIYQRPTYSRRVTGIDFSDPVRLRLGFVNELRYNWNSSVSEIARGSGDRRLQAFLHRWTIEMPWFVMYRFPAAYAGSELCWRGKVLWERAGERFEAITHPAMQCRMLTLQDSGRRILGVAIDRQPALAMRLEPNAEIALRQLAMPAAALLAVAAVLGLLVTWRPQRVVLPFALLATTLLVVCLNDAAFIGGVRPFDGGDDGLVYDGLARSMLRRLLAGDVAGALEGGEQVFFFTPGMRYLRAVEHLVFGETYLGYLSLILLLPFLVFALFRRFVPLHWALVAVAIFAAVPIGIVFGSSLVQYVKWAARGFADPAAAACFLAGLMLLIGRDVGGPHDRLGSAAGAGLLFAIALFVRPNLAPGAAILLAGAGAAAARQLQIRRVAGLCIGFLPVLGMALHNWVYGGVLVPFTSTAAHPTTLVMPPDAYLSALQELLRIDLAGPHVVRAFRQIGGWLAGPSEWVAMAPLNLAAIVVLLRVAARVQSDPWLRLIAGATLVQHCVAIFYATAGRYHHLTWLLTLLVTTAWMHDEGFEWLRQKLPAFSRWIRDHPAAAALTAAVERMARFHERTA